VSPTSFSLLNRLKVAGLEASDWNWLQGIYLPLIECWLTRVPGLGHESADLAQEVLLVVRREIPRFERRREGSFRAVGTEAIRAAGGSRATKLFWHSLDEP
jgi:hypothetical protein